jgi:hypothetical protein
MKKKLLFFHFLQRRVSDTIRDIQLEIGSARPFYPTSNRQTRHAKMTQDEFRQGKTRQDKTRRDKSRQDKTRQDKTSQHNTKQHATTPEET